MNGAKTKTASRTYARFLVSHAAAVTILSGENRNGPSVLAVSVGMHWLFGLMTSSPLGFVLSVTILPDVVHVQLGSHWGDEDGIAQ